MIVNCTYCDSEINKKPSLVGERNFCNTDCYSLYRIASRPKKNCPVCGLEFSFKKSDEPITCSKSCSNTLFRTKGGSNWNYARKAKNFYGDKCIGCGESRSYLLTVHHIDGNRKNSGIDNLEVVCQNCHALRHLKCVDGEWIFNTSSLTPRRFINLV